MDFDHKRFDSKLFVENDLKAKLAAVAALNKLGFVSSPLASWFGPDLQTNTFFVEVERRSISWPHETGFPYINVTIPYRKKRLRGYLTAQRPQLWFAVCSADGEHVGVLDQWDLSAAPIVKSTRLGGSERFYSFHRELFTWVCLHTGSDSVVEA